MSLMPCAPAGLKMLSEVMAELPTDHRDCLVAAYCYQDRVFDQEVWDLRPYTAAMLGRRRRSQRAMHPHIAVDLDTLPTRCQPSLKAALSSRRSPERKEPCRSS